jgi:hypothetical protein
LALLAVHDAAAISAGELGIPEPKPRTAASAGSNSRASPGITFDSPTGFGLNLGNIGVAVGGTKLAAGVAEQQGFTSDYDGSLAVVAGLGDPARWVGVDLVVTAISVADSFGDAGSAGIKVHRRLFGGGSFAAGIEDAVRWGGASDSRSRWYAAYSHVIPLAPSSRNQMPIVFNAGWGRVRHVEDAHVNKSAPFGSIAFLPVPWASLIFDWTGSYGSAAVSLMPIPSVPFVVTLGVSDVGDRYPIYGRRFSAAIGYLFSF